MRDNRVTAKNFICRDLASLVPMFTRWERELFSLESKYLNIRQLLVSYTWT